MRVNYFLALAKQCFSATTMMKQHQKKNNKPWGLVIKRINIKVFIKIINILFYVSFYEFSIDLFSI